MDSPEIPFIYIVLSLQIKCHEYIDIFTQELEIGHLFLVSCTKLQLQLSTFHHFSENQSHTIDLGHYLIDYENSSLSNLTVFMWSLSHTIASGGDVSIAVTPNDGDCSPNLY